MKKIVFLIVVAIVLSQTDSKAWGDENGDKVGFYLKIGYSGGSIGDFDFPGKDEASGLKKTWRSGLNIGFEYDIKLRPWFFIHSGLSYIPKGGYYQYENENVVVIGGNNSGTGKDFFQYKFNYVEIPLLARFRPMQSPTFVYFDLGFSPAFLLSASASESYWVTSTWLHAERKERSRPVSGVSGVDLPFTAGIGVVIPAKDNYGIFIQLHYSKGLNPVLAGKSNRTSVVSGSFGLWF